MQHPSAPPGPPYRRRQQLPLPRVQLKLIGHFFLVLFLGQLLQFLLSARAVAEMMGEHPELGVGAATDVVGSMQTSFFLTLAVLLPLTLSVGILSSFRFAGPVRKITGFLDAVAEGSQPEDCRLRQHDELHELCDAANRATASVRGRTAPTERERSERPAA